MARTARGRQLPLALIALLGLFLTTCTRPATPPANPHYVLGPPYHAAGIWWYPGESHALDETGLAAVYPERHPPLTSEGEVFSQDVAAAAHATLQLPAIARLTNLQNGRSVLLRINDRGSPTPHRLVEVTRRVAALLGMPRDTATQVRLTVLAAPSTAAEDQVGGAPRLAMTPAPRGAVQAADLAPPQGARQGGGRAVSAPIVAAPEAAAPAPLRLDETVTQERPLPGRLWVRTRHVSVLRIRGHPARQGDRPCAEHRHGARRTGGRVSRRAGPVRHRCRSRRRPGSGDRRRNLRRANRR